MDGEFLLLTTESREVDDYRLVRLDARTERPVATEVASLPFAGGRGLAYDGTTFWTTLRAQNTLVGFTAE